MNVERYVKLFILAVALGTFVALVHGVWFGSTHTCVRAHREYVPQTCGYDPAFETTTCYGGYEDEVCDEWRERR